MECFDKIKVGNLSEEFAKRVKDGMSDHEKRMIGNELAMKYHEQLHGELSKLKSSIGIKPTKFTSADKTLEINKAVEEHKAAEIEAEKNKPEQVSAVFAGGRVNGEVISREDGKVKIKAKDGTKYTVPERSLLKEVETVLSKYGNESNAKMTGHSIEVNGKENSVEQYVEKGKAVLKALFPDHNIQVHETEADYLSKGDKPQGSEGLFVPAEKTIHLNIERIRDMESGATVFHEIIHPIVREALESRSEGINEAYNQLLEMKDEKGMEAVWEHANHGYYAREYDKRVEAITEFLTRVADGKIDPTKLKYDLSTRIVDVINKIFKALGIDKTISTPGDLRKLAESIKESFDKADAKAVKEVLGRRKEVEGGEARASIKDIRDNAEELIRKHSDKSKQEIVDAFKKYLPEEEVGKIYDRVHVEEPPKTPTPPKEKVATGGENERLRSIKLADTGESRERLGLGEYEKRGETFSEWEAQADGALSRGYSVADLVNKLDKGNYTPEPFEQVILTKQYLALDKIASENPTDANIANFKNFVDKTDKEAGTKISKSLLARKVVQRPEDTLGAYFLDEMQSTGVDKLTEGQKEQSKKEFDEIDSLKKQLKEKIEEIQKRDAESKAKLSIEDIKKRSSKAPRKTKEQYESERDEIKQTIKDKLKKIRSEGPQATVLPYARELVAISPDIAKYVGSLISEGVDNLSDIVTRIHSELKDDIEGITEADVRDVIAGEYREPKKTKNELLAKKRDIQTEAKLLKKLDDIFKEPEPKVEKKLIERNKKITDLKKQIADFGQFEKEVANQGEKNAEFEGQKNASVEKELSKAEKEAEIADEKAKKEAERISKLRTPEQKAIDSRMSNMSKELTKINKQLETGDFSKPEKREPLKLTPEAQKIEDQLIEAKRQRHIRLLKQEFESHKWWQKRSVGILKWLNAPRTAMSSMDLSAPLRQGLIPTLSHPKLAYEAARQMLMAARSQKEFNRFFNQIKEDPRYDLMRQTKLALAEPDSPYLIAKEESYMGSNPVEQIPFFGKGVVASERAYVMYLNKLRTDLFNIYADKLEENGKTYSNSKKDYDRMAEYVNAVTGRANLGPLEKWAPALNSIFFSPRLIASRLKLMNPVFFSKLPKEIKKEYARDMASFVGVTMTTLGAFAAYGKSQDDDDPEKITVETDPRSADFLKIKQGRTRYDIMGGFQQYIRAATQITTGERKSTTAGNVAELNPEKRGSIALTMLRQKLSPTAGILADLVTQKNAIGQPLSVSKEVMNYALPMILTGTMEALNEGGAKRAVAVGASSFFGVGTTTYDPYKPKEKTFKIYNPYTEKERNATPEEYKKYEDLKQKFFNEEVEDLKKSGVFKDVYNEITSDEGKAEKTIPPDQLTEEEKKKLNRMLMEKASRRAKKEMFEGTDEKTTK